MKVSKILLASAVLSLSLNAFAEIVDNPEQKILVKGVITSHCGFEEGHDITTSTIDDSTTQQAWGSGDFYYHCNAPTVNIKVNTGLNSSTFGVWKMASGTDADYSYKLYYIQGNADFTTNCVGGNLWDSETISTFSRAAPGATSKARVKLCALTDFSTAPLPAHSDYQDTLTFTITGS